MFVLFGNLIYEEGNAMCPILFTKTYLYKHTCIMGGVQSGKHYGNAYKKKCSLCQKFLYVQNFPYFSPNVVPPLAPGYLVTVYEEDSGHVYTKSLLPARGVSITLLAISVH